MLRARILVIMLVVLVVALFVRLASLNPSGKQPTPAPNLTFAKLKGGPPSLEALKGKVVVLDFWATWCGPCRMSMPRLNDLAKQYKGKGLEVIGISLDDPSTQRAIPGVLKELQIAYPVTLASDIPDLANNYPHDSIPSIYVIDRQGMIRYYFDGYAPEIDQEIVNVVNES